MGPRWSASLRQAMEKYRFAVHAGTTSETWLGGRMGASASGATAVTVDAYADGLKAVVDGRADAFFGDRPILLDMASRSPAAGDLILLPLQGTREPLAIGLARGDEDFRLLVDRTLSRLYRSGEIGDIYATFFGEPDADALTFFGSPEIGRASCRERVCQ